MKGLFSRTFSGLFKFFQCLPVLTILLSSTATADELRQLWTLAPASRPYITTDNSQRGIAYNPVTKHVLMVNRAGGLSVVILDSANGNEIGFLDVSGIGGGTFALSMIGVADDGVIYAANLSTSTTAPNLKVYRWTDEASIPTVAFEGDPAAGASNQRWGDSMDVRGAGNNTQILFGSNAGTIAALLSTTDGENFTGATISNASAAGALGVSFGLGNTIWTKRQTASSLRQVAFNPATGVGTVLRNYGNPVPATVVPIAVSGNLLVGIAFETPDNVRAFDISDLAGGPVLLDQKALPTDNANANLAGSVDVSGDLVFVLDTNNGIVAYRRIVSVVPPTVSTQPASVSLLEGGTVTLNTSVIGTKPLSYQWFFGPDPVPGATNSSLVLSNIAVNLAGNYTLSVSNAAGTTNSNPAVISVTRTVRTDVLTKLWTLAPGSRPYITDQNTERGVAYNPKTGHVLLVSRLAPVEIWVLDAKTGAELYRMNTDPSIVSGSEPEGFRLNLVRVADDGSVYAANLSTTGSKFAIYRWADDGATTSPALAWGGDPAPGSGQRWGDNMDVRGASDRTEILMASRNGTVVALFNTIDGQNFNPTIIDVPGANPGNFGLGVAFGKGNTFWGKATGPTAPLRHVEFDPISGLGTVLQTFVSPAVRTSVGAIEVDPVTATLYAIGVENPDNLQVYNIANLAANPIPRDVEFFPTDLENANATAAIDVSGDKVLALDTNNGLMALQLNTSLLRAPRLIPDGAPANGTFTISFFGIPGDTYSVEASTDLKSWVPVFGVVGDASGIVILGDNNAGNFPYRFYRATAK
jgi:hypothetical protein